MDEELRERVRDAIMDTFRTWGGQWNVSPVPPGTGDAPPDRWLLRVPSRPLARGSVSAETVETYLSHPTDPGVLERWHAELRPVFDRAREQAP
jgi:hypothetical protein